MTATRPTTLWAAERLPFSYHYCIVDPACPHGSLCGRFVGHHRIPLAEVPDVLVCPDCLDERPYRDQWGWPIAAGIVIVSLAAWGWVGWTVYRLIFR